jgi:hypothetical protein
MEINGELHSIMAHFAKLGTENIILQIVALSNNAILDKDGKEREQIGMDFLNNLYKTNDVWKQTSYSTQEGVHKLDETPLRKNYAAIGHKYDEDRDAFIAPKPYSSWTLNEDTCIWEAPSAKPDDGKIYKWNEETTSWDEVVLPS